MKIFKGLCVIAILFLLGACDDMLDNIRPYLDKGEPVYVGKVDSLYTHVGQNRLELIIRLKSGFTQAKCQVSTTDPDGVQDTVYYDIARQNGEQYLKYMFTGLKEGQYDFSVTMLDDSGNRSLKALASGYSYGNFYQSTLFNRRMNGVQVRDGKAVLNWRSIESALYTLVTYTTSDGENQTLEVPASQSETVIGSYLPGSKFTWITAYKPKVTALDTFYSDDNENVFPDE